MEGVDPSRTFISFRCGNFDDQLLEHHEAGLDDGAHFRVCHSGLRVSCCAIAHKQEDNLKPSKNASLPCLVGGAANATPGHQAPKEFPD